MAAYGSLPAGALPFLLSIILYVNALCCPNCILMMMSMNGDELLYHRWNLFILNLICKTVHF